jgi:hypothetical protein
MLQASAIELGEFPLEIIGPGSSRTRSSAAVFRAADKLRIAHEMAPRLRRGKPNFGEKPGG